MKLKLYHYWRSSSSWRVRWALALKSLNVEYIAINILSDEPESPAHLQRNPLGYVPVLEVTQPGQDPWILTESTAIIEFIEELYPEPALLPKDPFQRARVRQLAQIINADTQPLQNPNVAEKFTTDLKLKLEWNQYWIRKGLKAYEVTAQPTAGRFSVGDTVTLADLCLIPQCYNAIRNEINLATEFPLIQQIYQTALETPACKQSAPEVFQP